MICIIHKILVLLKMTRILKQFLRSIKNTYFFYKKVIFFSQQIMMESPGLGKENIIAYIRDWKIKDIINIFRLKKENKAIKYRMLRDIRNVFRLEKN